MIVCTCSNCGKEFNAVNTLNWSTDSYCESCWEAVVVDAALRVTRAAVAEAVEVKHDC